MRFLALMVGLTLLGCPGDDTTGETDACRLAAQVQGCPECADGVVECVLDGVTVSEMSCGGCQAEQALVTALCDAGSEVTEAEIEADGVCVPADGG